MMSASQEDIGYPPGGLSGESRVQDEAENLPKDTFKA